MKKKKESGKIKIQEKKKKFTYTILVAFAIVIFWRGIWGIMDLYFFPNMLPLSFILSIFFGFLILFSVKRSWNLLE